MALPDPPFLLVVTYKHFLLWNGSSLMQFAGDASLPESFKVLDMTRVYFASIEEFDYLAAGLQARSIHPTEFFLTARRSDQDFRTNKFMLMQHINAELSPYGTPKYLRQEEASLMKLLEQALPRT